MTKDFHAVQCSLSRHICFERKEFFMKQSGMIKQIKYVSLIIAVLSIVIGAILLVKPDISAVAICYVIGSIIIISGITRITGYFSRDIFNLNYQFDFAIGVFLIILGIVLICHPKNIIAMLHFIVGIIVLVDSVFKLQTALEAKHFGLNKWWLILGAAVVCAVFGILLIAYPFETASLLIRILGLAVIVTNLENIFMILYTVRIRKKTGPISVEYSEITIDASDD